MKFPLVSVIVPMYNVERYIASTIQCVLDQTWKYIELIIVDDGSTDRSFSIAKEFKDQRIKIIQQQNQGAAIARNTGIKHASGDFFQFLDGDDLLSEDKIENQVELLLKRPAYVSVSSTIHFNNNDSIAKQVPSKYEQYFLKSSDDPADFLTHLWGGYTSYGSMIAVHSWLTPKSIIVKTGFWNEALTLDDDGEYFARVVLNSKGIIYSDQGFSYYRKQKGNTLSRINSEAKIKSMLDAALIKKKILTEKTNMFPAQLALYKLLMDVAIKSFPQYPSVYKIALKELPLISPKKYEPSIGGPKIQKIAMLFGWKTARIIQYILKQK